MKNIRQIVMQIDEEEKMIKKKIERKRSTNVKVQEVPNPRV